MLLFLPLPSISPHPLAPSINRPPLPLAPPPFSLPPFSSSPLPPPPSLQTERAAAQDAAAAASTRITALEKEIADKGAALDDIRRRLRTCDGERLDALSSLKRVETELADVVATARRDKVRGARVTFD